MRALPGFHLFSASSRVNIFTFKIRIRQWLFVQNRLGSQVISMLWFRPRRLKGS